VRIAPFGAQDASVPPQASHLSRISLTDGRWAATTDGELIRLTGLGDGDAFEQLYGRFSKRVFGWALRWLRDRSRAEDATQETFAAVWRSASTYRPERGPGAPWLFAVARNAVVNETRARVPVAAAPIDTPSNEPGPSDRAETAWVSRRVHLAVAELPDELRTLIELAYWRGLTQSEIAMHVGVPLGTIKTRTRSALARLADALDGDVRLGDRETM
jgi:RNA polymerase sigma-70 factor, ECF subfamily